MIFWRRISLLLSMMSWMKAMMRMKARTRKTMTLNADDVLEKNKKVSLLMLVLMEMTTRKTMTMII